MDIAENKNRKTNGERMAVITYEEVLKQIESLNNKQPDGFTITEMSDTVGRSQRWCRGQVRKMIDAGRVRFNGKRTVLRIDGVPSQTPVYVFVE